MPEMLKRVGRRSQSANTDEDPVDSYWLAHEGGYYVKLDVKDREYTLSWETPVSPHGFIKSVLDLNQITNEAARGEFTVDDETVHLEMGELPLIRKHDDFSERCNYCKIIDEFEGEPLEIDWVGFGRGAWIELTTRNLSPIEFRNFIQITTDPDDIDENDVMTVVTEAQYLLQERQE